MTDRRSHKKQYRLQKKEPRSTRLWCQRVTTEKGQEFFALFTKKALSITNEPVNLQLFKVCQ